MKTFVKNILSAFLLIAFMVAQAPTMAQSREYDDMYFKSSDRKKAKAAKENEMAATKKADKKQDQRALQSNDSFSARNMNPEYVSRNNAAQLAEEEGRNTYSEDDYFVEELDRNPTSTFQNQPYMMSNLHGRGFYDPRMMNAWGFRNPYFNPMWGGGFYDPWMMGMYDPFWGPTMGTGFRMNMGFSYGWGWNRWHCPWGWNSWGMGGFYDPFWGPTWGMGGWYPTRVVVVNNYSGSDLSGRNVTRGTRDTRSSAIRSGSDISSSTTGRLANYDGSSRTRSTEDVRTRDASNRYSTATQSDYYNRTATTNSRNSRTYSGTDQNTSTTGGTVRQGSRGTTGTLAPRGNAPQQRNSQTFRQRSTETNRAGSTGGGYTPNYNRSGNTGGYAPSRSSGGSYTPSSPSRSTGGSYTPSPSRSSGGSSPAPSRSSGGGSSSSRGGRGN
jgi:hypothetical protein